jgi:hypothetical protein
MNLSFNFPPRADDRPYTTWDGVAPAKNPVTVSMVGKCVRQQAYHHRGEPRVKHPNIDAFKTEATFDIGTAVHEVIQRGLEGIRDVERTVRVTLSGYALEGRIDGLINLPEGGTALVEAKTMNAHAFEKFKTQAVVDRSYRVQAHTYASMLKLAGELVDHILWIAIDRGTLETCTRLEPVDRELAVIGMNNALTAVRNAPENLPRLAVAGSRLSWECAYCPFWQSCWGDRVRPVEGKVALEVVG